MSKAVEIIDGVLFVHTRHYDDVNRVIICHQKKPYRVFSDDEKKDEQRQHGEWEIDSEDGNMYHLFCSECKKDFEEYISGTEMWWLNKIPNFCPHCGSCMVLGGDEE